MTERMLVIDMRIDDSADIQAYQPHAPERQRQSLQ
jgi:hypothetical protein